MINVASICGEGAKDCPVTYQTSKWAEVGFSKNAARNYAKHGIRVNVLAPGPVDTPMLRQGRSEHDPIWLAEKAAIAKDVPLHRVADPWEMAGPITFLASDQSSYVTGLVLTADGGITTFEKF